MSVNEFNGLGSRLSTRLGDSEALNTQPRARHVCASESDRVASPKPPAAGQLRPPVIHCVYREGLSAIFRSQILTPVRQYQSDGWDVRLVVFTPIGEYLRRPAREAWESQSAAIREVVGGRFHRLPSGPARIHSLRADALLFKTWIHEQPWVDQPFILHCRGRSMTLIAAQALTQLPHGRLIFDCRGLGHVEGSGRGNSESTGLAKLDREAVRRADVVLCVSDTMKRVLEPVAAGKAVVVSPCVVDTAHFAAQMRHRDRIREELGLTRRFVVVYCGSLTPWQLPEHSARVFKIIRQVDRTAHFLAVTTQPDTMRRRLHQAGLSDQSMTVVSVPHEEVGNYLAAGDVGLLLRESRFFNEVASPVKFAEYLAAGMPVILTEGIGDYSEMVSREDLGLVIDIDDSGTELERRVGDFVARVTENRTELQERCSGAARRWLDATQRQDRVVRLYTALAGGERPQDQPDSAAPGLAR
ncbi:MAG: glycosyltransferase [Deltaproteobacteria bacterium]|nr:glycosyltransferase [Deltaproteobacteria bacterium]